VTAPQTPLPAALAEHGDDEPWIEVDGPEHRRLLEIVLANVREPEPPPRSDRDLDNLAWGLAQPILGLRLLLGRGDLFVRAIGPLVLLLLICVIVARQQQAEGFVGAVAAYYSVLVAAAQISPVIFTKNFAKLAADARPHLDVPRHEPYLRSYGQAFVESVVQLVVLGVGVAPLAWLLSKVPLVGSIVAGLVTWVWLAHWIVVEALDSARTLPPGEDAETLEQRHARLDLPWYAAPAAWHVRGFFALVFLPFRMWASVLGRLGKRWRGEVQVIETRPWLSAGFGLSAWLVLAIPVLNLLFRPALVIAASHMLGRIEPELPEPPPPEDEDDGDGSGDDDEAEQGA
jgi:hypothetical protein